MACGYIHPALTWMVLLLAFGVIIEQGYGWNTQPNAYYQGASNGGYFDGRGAGSLSSQGLGGTSGGSWSAGGGGFQGQASAGASGGVDRTVGFGANQWTGGDGRGFPGGVAGGGAVGGAVGGVAGEVSTAGDTYGADGTGFQQAGGINSGASLATGSEGAAGYNNQGSFGNFGASNVGFGQLTPHHTNGPVADTSAFAGSFGSSGSGFGAGGHYHGSRPTTSTYGAPSAQPWRYGAPNYGGYGVTRWPWHGNGYVYRVPVAHINPDGGYSFSYYTPHSSREETGHSNGNVEGTYGFQNDGAKHNFSFNAAPDVDLRTNVGDSRVGVLNPEEYGPQSVHSRARLPLVPGRTFQPGVDDQTRTGDGVPNGWSGRSGATEGANDQSSLAVVGLPKASTEATDTSPPTVAVATDRNQIVRGSTEPVAVTDLEERVSQPDGTVTTVPPLTGSVEQVVTRPENEVPSYGNEIGQNDIHYNSVANGGYQPFGAGTPNVARDDTFSPDRSYRFGYRTPDAAREESADQAGNVRGSFSYNNEAGRNDMQYVAGAGVGFRPTGGSLSVPNGLAGVGTATAGPTGTGVFGGSGTGFEDTGVVENQGVGGTLGGSSNGFRGSGVVGNQGGQGIGGSFGGSGNGVGGSGVFGNQGGQGVGGTFEGAGSGFGDTGVVRNQGGQGVGGTFGGTGNGFGGSGVFENQGGQRVGGNLGGTDTGLVGLGVVGNQGGLGEEGVFGESGTGLGGSGLVGNQGGLGEEGSFGGSGTGLGGSGVVGNQGGLGEEGSFGGSGFRSTEVFGNEGSQRAGGNQGGSGFGVQRGVGAQPGAGVGGSFGGSTAGFGGDGRSRTSGNQGTQFGLGTGTQGAGFGSDGRPLSFGNQGSQLGAGAGGAFGTGAGARGSFGGFDRRSYPFGNQAGQGFSSPGTGSTVGFAGNQGTTHNPVTRSPSVNGFNGASTTGQWNGATSRSVSASSTEDRTDESTTINDDDSEQTTSFGGYGDVAGVGLFNNGNRRLVQRY